MVVRRYWHDVAKPRRQTSAVPRLAVLARLARNFIALLRAAHHMRGGSRADVVVANLVRS